MIVAYGIKVKITTRSLIAIAVIAGFFSPQAHTGVPTVAVDIPPVASLVGQVMGDLGQPRLIVPTGVSPHSHTMRPSQARTLQNADIVFWVGRDLTVGLARSIKALASNAVSVSLIDVPGITLLPFRHGTTFEENGHEAHDHNGGTDPHVWLDPENAQVWLEVIAAELAKLDPDNASSYLYRARVGRNALKELTHHLSVQLAPIRGRPFVVFHDAYQYFEHRFDIRATGSIVLSEASDPGPVRIAEIRDAVLKLEVHCVFAEPQFEPKLIATVIEGADARSGTLDPLGASLQAGPDLYSQLLRNLVRDLEDCLE
jgi:zinc transport system substrate-binding protein